MSRNLSTKCGSLDSLNRRMRWGRSPRPRQMRWTELTLTPTAFAIAAPAWCVASPGGASIVRTTTRSATEGSSLGMREGRVLSRRRPSKALERETLLPAPDACLGLAGLGL